MINFRGGINLKEYNNRSLFDRGTVDPGLVYTQYLIDTYGMQEIWRGTDMVDSTILASVSSARNGTAAGWTLTAPFAIPGPVSGEAGLAPYSDGANDLGNIFSASLASIYNGDLGAWGIWLKVANSGVWTDGVVRNGMTLYTDINNRQYLNKRSTNGSVRNLRITSAGNIFTVTSSGITTTSWAFFGGNYNSAGNTEMFFISPSGTVAVSVAAPGNWVGALTEAYIGGQAGPVNVWSGNWSYAMVKFGATFSQVQWEDIYNKAL